jgi:UDP-N-acetyl-D-glucosamine dehydrogenase
MRRGAVVSYTDPFVPEFQHAGHTLTSVPFDAACDPVPDCAVVTTDHSVFDYARIADLPLVVDTRNALKAFSRPSIFSL